MLAKVKKFWEKYEVKIILLAAFVLVAVISFEAGIIKGQEEKLDPIIIEKPAITQETASKEADSPKESQNPSSEGQKPDNQEGISSAPEQNCAYVGSKNSDKYHLPTCSYAKRIKAENRVCFSSANEAQSKGYAPDSNCVK